MLPDGGRQCGRNPCFNCGSTTTIATRNRTNGPTEERFPAYTHHKPTRQARVRIGGTDFYSGEYGAADSRRRYRELIAQAFSGQTPEPIRGGTTTIQPEADSGPTVAELLLAFKRYADGYYVVDGKQSAEVDCFNSAMRPVRELYAMTPAASFTPLMHKAVQQKYVEAGWSCGFCNKSTNRVRHIWKWAVGNGMVPVATWQALQAVSGLKAGHTTAPDHKRREAVPDDRIEAVRSRLSPRNRDLFDLILATGSRPSELLGLTMADIDTSGEIWLADLEKHKNANRGLNRKIFFGPKSQLILRRCPSSGPLFAIKRGSFSNAVKLACERAGVAPFVPYELRHTKSTERRDTMSIASAQATLGHAQPSMTARYSTKIDKLAIKAAKACG